MLPSIFGHHKYFILQEGGKRIWNSLFHTSKTNKFFTEISKHRYFFFFQSALNLSSLSPCICSVKYPRII